MMQKPPTFTCFLHAIGIILPLKRVASTATASRHTTTATTLSEHRLHHLDRSLSPVCRQRSPTAGFTPSSSDMMTIQVLYLLNQKYSNIR
jgi:hypothetical protein